MIILYPIEHGVKRKRPSVAQRKHMLRRLSESQNNKCCHCGGKLLFREDFPHSVEGNLHKHYATIEHLIPHRYGGGWNYENLAAAHYCCNKYYTDSTSIGFYKYRRILKQQMGINLKLHPENYERTEDVLRNESEYLQRC